MIAVMLAMLVTGQYDVEVLRDAGTVNRINLVILGDGYRTEDQTLFSSNANDVVKTLFAATPWKEYAGLFNVSIIHVISNQNGADQGSYGATRDTALGSYFGCGGVDRTICFDSTTVFQIATDLTPQYTQLVVLVNDPKYGGSGGVIAALSTNSNAPEILIHELGHSVGLLADEYDQAYPAYPVCPHPDCTEANASRISNSTIKWDAWIVGSVPLPTPEGTSQYADNIGAFEGCRYMTTGLFRPKDVNCRMQILGVPYCSVCVEGLVEKFLNHVSLVDSHSPTTATSVCGNATFTVVPAPIRSLSYAWSVNGVARDGGASISVPVTSAGASVSVVVTHSTALVRNDPNHLLSETVTFPVVSSNCSSAPTDAGTVQPPFDAGMPVQPHDAGTPPVEPKDAGTGGRPDAGSSNGGTTSGSCGCTSTWSGAWLALLALMALKRRAHGR